MGLVSDVMILVRNLRFGYETGICFVTASNGGCLRRFELLWLRNDDGDQTALK